MFSRSPSHKVGFALDDTTQIQEAVPCPKTLQCRCKRRGDSRVDVETGKQKDPMTVWVWDHSTAVFSAFNWHGVKESLKEGFEDNRISYSISEKLLPTVKGSVG